MAQKKKESGQPERTARNKKRRLDQEAARQRRLAARTQALIGQHVSVRTKDQVKPLVGTVLDVISKGDERYPTDARRHYGKYLSVRTAMGELVASRHRCKPLKGEEQR